MLAKHNLCCVSCCAFINNFSAWSMICICFITFISSFSFSSFFCTNLQRFTAMSNLFLIEFAAVSPVPVSCHLMKQVIYTIKNLPCILGCQHRCLSSFFIVSHFHLRGVYQTQANRLRLSLLFLHCFVHMYVYVLFL